MKIVDSSIPGLANEDAAKWLLTERAMLTSLVCRELESAADTIDRRPRAALNALRLWLRDVMEIEFGYPDRRIDDMVVPPGCEDLIEEIRAGSPVAARFVMLNTADTQSEVNSDTVKLNDALAVWRKASATGFRTEPVSAPPVPVESAEDTTPLMYMVAHAELRLRKVGITRLASDGKPESNRLALWRQRGWDLVEVRTFEAPGQMSAAEDTALDRLDRMHARATARMAALFPNLEANGRTEMYDPLCFDRDLTSLLSPELGDKLDGVAPNVPLWISAPKSAAAVKAMQHPGRDNSAAARKAWLTRKAQDEAGL